jgi:hypothetical protein
MSMELIGFVDVSCIWNPKNMVWTVTYHVTSQKWSHPMNCLYTVEIVQL